MQELLLETMKLHNRKEFETYFLALDRVSPHHPNTHPLSLISLGCAGQRDGGRVCGYFCGPERDAVSVRVLTSAYTSGRSLS